MARQNAGVVSGTSSQGRGRAAHDYADRQGYKKIETLVGAPAMAGRMARFQFTPQALPVAQMGWIMAAYANPN